LLLMLLIELLIENGAYCAPFLRDVGRSGEIARKRPRSAEFCGSK
jgi:hypothetical protein